MTCQVCGGTPVNKVELRYLCERCEKLQREACLAYEALKQYEAGAVPPPAIPQEALDDDPPYLGAGAVPPLAELPLMVYMTTKDGPTRDAAFLRLYAEKVRNGTAITWEIPSTVAGTLEAIAARIEGAAPLVEPPSRTSRLHALAWNTSWRNHERCSDDTGIGVREGHQEKHGRCPHADCALVRDLRAEPGPASLVEQVKAPSLTPKECDKAIALLKSIGTACGHPDEGTWSRCRHCLAVMELEHRDVRRWIRALADWFPEALIAAVPVRTEDIEELRTQLHPPKVE